MLQKRRIAVIGLALFAVVAAVAAEVGVKTDEIRIGQCAALTGPAAGLGLGMQAGELGFQVVAGEVKKLAQAAGEATQAIDARITANQEETQRVQEVFSKITQFIAQIHSMQDSIAGAVTKQTETTRDIGARIQETAARFRGSETHGGIYVMAQKLSRMAGNLERLCDTDVEDRDEAVVAPQVANARARQR